MTVKMRRYSTNGGKGADTGEFGILTDLMHENCVERIEIIGNLADVF